jgi:hypothetical protein
MNNVHAGAYVLESKVTFNSNYNDEKYKKKYV